jgi:opacity protein-like surface antigen
MTFLGKSVVFAALLAGLAAAPAAAQEPRINLTFTPAFATVGGDTEMALSGSAGYRFTDHLWFEGDFTWIGAAAAGDFGRVFPMGGVEFTTGSVVGGVIGGVIGGVTGGVTDIVTRTTGRFGGLDLRTPRLPIIPIPIEGFGVTDGQTMIGTLGVRYEPTVQTARFRPYVSAGLGLNHTDQELTFRIAAMPSFSDSISHSGFAFSAGGGASIRLFSSLWANADAKYFRLSRDRNVMRLGGGVGFRF